MFDALLGRSTIVTGIEDGEDGWTKVYVGARYLGWFLLCRGEAAAEVRHAWGSGPGFVFTKLPDDACLWHDRKRPYPSIAPDLQHQVAWEAWDSGTYS